MEVNKRNQLRELLDHHHKWPDAFTFKFIYKCDPETELKLKKLFNTQSKITIKSSSKNNFNSMSVVHISSNADEIMDIYQQASEIEGVMSL